MSAYKDELRFDRPISSSSGDTVLEGNSGAAARSDHRHGREAADANLGGTITTSAVGDSADGGAATTGSRSDHKHGREAFATTSDIADVAATEAAGSASTVPHGDHVHALSSLAAWSSYSPSFTNVTSGAATVASIAHGKTLLLRGGFTAGTATANGTVAISFPATSVAATQIVTAINGNAVSQAIVAGSATVITFRKDAAGTAFTAGDSLTAVRWSAVIEIT